MNNLTAYIISDRFPSDDHAIASEIEQIANRNEVLACGGYRATEEECVKAYLQSINIQLEQELIAAGIIELAIRGVPKDQLCRELQELRIQTSISLEQIAHGLSKPGQALKTGKGFTPEYPALAIRFRGSMENLKQFQADLEKEPEVYTTLIE